MMKFKTGNLTSKTNEQDRAKLVSALKGVHGVENAVLHPESSEFEIKARDKQQPKADDIKAAASKSGFKIT